MALNGTVLVLGVIFLAWRRPGRRGIRLRLRGGLRSPRAQISTKAVIVKPPPSMNKSRPRVNNTKALNVHFMYNGHSFDAYEVLGLPAGCGWSQIEQSYRDLLKRDAQSKEFLDLALQSLRQHLRAS